MPLTIPYRNIAITKNTAKRFPVVGRCIYCPDGIAPFTKEHVIPIGLGGGMILPEASCSNCQRIIHEIETYLMRGPFLSHRLANGLVRNLKDLGDKVPMKMVIGGKPITVHFARDNVPNYLCMPSLGQAPGISVNRAPAPFERFPFWIGGDENRLRALNAIGNLVLAYKFSANAFFRVLAKIAHAYISGEIGLDSFDPMLPEFILGRDDNAGSYLIGKWPEDGMAQINGTCQIGMAFCRWGNQDLVNVRLRLFPSHPLIPIYHVVVGTLTKPIDEILARLGLQTAGPNKQEVYPLSP
jgi:hypothetical protein